MLMPLCPVLELSYAGAVHHVGAIVPSFGAIHCRNYPFCLCQVLVPLCPVLELSVAGAIHLHSCTFFLCHGFTHDRLACQATSPLLIGALWHRLQLGCAFFGHQCVLVAFTATPSYFFCAVLGLCMLHCEALRSSSSIGLSAVCTLTSQQWQQA